MSIQQRRHMENMQAFMNTFKQFEKRLDKMQYVMNQQGHKLDDLRNMMANVASKIDTPEQVPNKLKRNVSTQYDTIYNYKQQDRSLPIAPNKSYDLSLQLLKTAKDKFKSTKKIKAETKHSARRSEENPPMNVMKLF